MSKHNKKERGKLLTALLIFSVLGIVLNIYNSLKNYLFPSPTIHIPDWYLLYGILAIGFSIAIFIGLVKWKKWVIPTIMLMLLTGITATTALIYSANINVTNLDILLIIGGLIIAILIWSIPIYRKWQYFE